MSQIHEELRAPEGHKHTYVHTQMALYREITMSHQKTKKNFHQINKKMLKQEKLMVKMRVEKS